MKNSFDLRSKTQNKSRFKRKIIQTQNKEKIETHEE